MYHLAIYVQLGAADMLFHIMHNIFKVLSFYLIAPSGPPKSLSVSVQSAQSIELNWQPPSPSDQNGVITGYIIVVTPLITGISQRLITAVTTTLLVPNLAPYTNYICIVAAMTAIGRGPFTTVITVQTLEAGKLVIFITRIGMISDVCLVCVHANGWCYNICCSC